MLCRSSVHLCASAFTLEVAVIISVARVWETRVPLVSQCLYQEIGGKGKGMLSSTLGEFIAHHKHLISTRTQTTVDTPCVWHSIQSSISQ